MNKKYLLTIKITQYDEELTDKIRASMNDIYDDELGEKYKNDYRYTEYINSKRERADLIPENDYIRHLEKLFNPKNPSSFDDVMRFGAFVLKESEVLNIKKRMNANASE